MKFATRTAARGATLAAVLFSMFRAAMPVYAQVTVLSPTPVPPAIPTVGVALNLSPDPPQPEIHGPNVVGFSPGRPFLYRVPASGTDPITFVASGLPPGLGINPQTGIISGTDTAAGTSQVRVIASNTTGRAERTLTLICGKGQLARTPPMGWNAYGIDGDSVTDAQVRQAADALVSTGLAAHGYNYVLLGDSWQGARDASGILQPNHRFPDMKGLIAYVHSKGLKFGLYSASTDQTCSGYVGSEGHETQDAQIFADWGVDYLSYAWCPTAAEQSDPNASPGDKDPQPGFTAMSHALAAVNHDIFYAIQLPRQRWEPDGIGDNSFEPLFGLYDAPHVILGAVSDASYRRDSYGPGHWLAIGPLMVGHIGYPTPHLTKLTLGEQMTQMTLWAMLASPLIADCSLDFLNPNSLSRVTSAVLTNDDVIAVDQDPLAKAPMNLGSNSELLLWAKPLADGRVAVAFVNMTDATVRKAVSFSDINLTGAQPVRDLWQQKDLGTFSTQYETLVPAHGVVFVAIGHAKGEQ